MIVKTNKTSIYLTNYNKSTVTPTLFLHGFTGSSKSWSFINKDYKKFIYIDIPGHGKSTFNDLNVKYSINDFINDLYIIINDLQINKLNILGYSMGGRLAAAFACKYPNMIDKLILESTSLGIEDYNKRIIRYKKDKDLSNEISDNYSNFINQWQNNSLFTHQEKRNKNAFIEQLNIREHQNSNQISKSLESFSIGSMEPLHDKFQNLTCKIYLINGNEDNKYIREGRLMLRLNPKSIQYIINNSSHNTHIENTEEFLYVANNKILI